MFLRGSIHAQNSSPSARETTSMQSRPPAHPAPDKSQSEPLLIEQKQGHSIN
jgi:hypothetical protein